LLLDAPPTVQTAVASALGGWNVVPFEVASGSDDAGPGRSRLARTAASHDAEVVVWLTERDGQATLHLYHAPSRRTSSRPLGARPPFDDAGAAAVALSLRSLLWQAEREAAAAAAAEKTLPERRDAEPAPAPTTVTGTDSPGDGIGISLLVGGYWLHDWRPGLNAAALWKADRWKKTLLAARLGFGCCGDLDIDVPGMGIGTGHSWHLEAGMELRRTVLDGSAVGMELLFAGFVRRGSASIEFDSDDPGADDVSWHPGFAAGVRGLVAGIEVGGEFRFIPLGVRLTDAGREIHSEQQWSVLIGAGYRWSR
jgi:hypothetical protein